MADVPKQLEANAGACADVGLVPGPVDGTRPGAPRLDTLRRVYEDYADQLVANIRRRFGNGPPDPEDIAHEAFRRVCEYPDWSNIRNIRGFLWRIASNLVMTAKTSEAIRSKYERDIEQVFFPEDGDLSTPETVIIARDQLDAINDLLAGMPERRRWALILHRLEGLTQQQVARRLGISRSAVAKHLNRAEKEVSELFLEEDGN